MTQRKVVKNVTDMEIDEISVVDRGGNQFADMVIAKRAPEEEESMTALFNESGEPLTEDALEDGQIVFDDGGNAYRFELDENADGIQIVEDAPEEVEYDQAEHEPELVDKGFADPFRALAQAAKTAMPKFGQAGAHAGAAGAGTGTAGKRIAGAGAHVGPAGPGTGAGGAHKLGLGARIKTAAKPLTSTPGRTIATGAAIGAGGAGTVAAFKKNDDSVRKSFSDEVLEELSKAMSDEDRDEVLSKALGQVEELLQAQAEAVEIAKSERELRLVNEYISKAAEYNLPVNANELGPVLYRMVEQMDFEDCAVIAKCLDAASSALFDEVGYIGGGDNADPLERVNALVGQNISKASDGPSAFLDVMDENPAAYDQYLAARRGY